MAYELEIWTSDRPRKPIGGGEVREHVVRVLNLADAQTVYAGMIATLSTGAARITLSDTRGRIWDVLRLPCRDTDLDTDTRSLTDLRPVGAARPKVKRRGGTQ